MLFKAFKDKIPQPIHAKGKKFDHNQIVEPVHHQPAQAIRLRVDHPPSIGVLLQAQNIPT